MNLTPTTTAVDFDGIAIPITGWAVFGGEAVDFLTGTEGFRRFGADEGEAAFAYAAEVGGIASPEVDIPRVTMTPEEFDALTEDERDEVEAVEAVEHSLRTPEVEGDPELMTLLPGGITGADHTAAGNIARNAVRGLLAEGEAEAQIIELLAEVAGRVADANGVDRIEVLV